MKNGIHVWYNYDYIKKAYFKQPICRSESGEINWWYEHLSYIIYSD